MSRKMLLTAAVAASTSALMTTTAHAGTTAVSSAAAYVAPTAWTRSASANSAYALWDNSFTSFTQNNVLYTGSNLAAANVMTEYPTVLTGWNVSDANTGLITGSQHIYGGSVANLALSLTIPNYGLGSAYTTDFRLQTTTATLALDPNSFTISADGGAAIAITPTVTNLGGTNFNNLYEFTLPGNASSYTLNFSTPVSGTNFENTSLNALAIDTFASVPEPASIAVIGFGAVSLLRRRARKAV